MKLTVQAITPAPRQLKDRELGRIPKRLLHKSKAGYRLGPEELLLYWKLQKWYFATTPTSLPAWIELPEDGPAYLLPREFRLEILCKGLRFKNHHLGEAVLTGEFRLLLATAQEPHPLLPLLPSSENIDLPTHLGKLLSCALHQIIDMGVTQVDVTAPLREQQLNQQLGSQNSALAEILEKQCGLQVVQKSDNGLTCLSCCCPDIDAELDAERKAENERAAIRRKKHTQEALEKAELEQKARELEKKKIAAQKTEILEKQNHNRKRRSQEEVKGRLEMNLIQEQIEALRAERKCNDQILAEIPKMMAPLAEQLEKLAGVLNETNGRQQQTYLEGLEREREKQNKLEQRNKELEQLLQALEQRIDQLEQQDLQEPAGERQEAETEEVDPPSPPQEPIFTLHLHKPNPRPIDPLRLMVRWRHYSNLGQGRAGSVRYLADFAEVDSGDYLDVEVQTNQDCRIYILNRDRRQHFVQLLPEERRILGITRENIQQACVSSIWPGENNNRDGFSHLPFWQLDDIDCREELVVLASLTPLSAKEIQGLLKNDLRRATPTGMRGVKAPGPTNANGAESDVICGLEGDGLVCHRLLLTHLPVNE